MVERMNHAILGLKILRPSFRDSLHTGTRGGADVGEATPPRELKSETPRRFLDLAEREAKSSAVVRQPTEGIARETCGRYYQLWHDYFVESPRRPLLPLPFVRRPPKISGLSACISIDHHEAED
jgi:hypothetical protein